MKIKGDSRAVGWDCKNDASKALLWVPQGTNQIVVKPVMGLRTGPVLTDTGVGHFNSVFSGPSTFEVGESSLAGEGISAQTQLTLAHPQSFDPELEVPDQCAKLPTEADGPFSTGTSSGESSLPLGKADGLSSAGTSSGKPKLPLGKADGLSYAGTSSVGPSLPPGKVAGPFSVGNSPNEPMVSPGKSVKVFMRSSVESFLADFFLSLSRAGLVVLGDKDGLKVAGSVVPTLGQKLSLILSNLA